MCVGGRNAETSSLQAVVKLHWLAMLSNTKIWLELKYMHTPASSRPDHVRNVLQEDCRKAD